MAVSERQKKLKKMTIIFGIVSYGILLGFALFYTISAFVNINHVEDGIQIFTDEAKKFVISLSITTIIGIIISFFLKEGMRVFMWIVCVILGSLIYKSVGMYLTLSAWLVDEYVFHKIFQYYKNKLSIRKEIDKE